MDLQSIDLPKNMYHANFIKRMYIDTYMVNYTVDYYSKYLKYKAKYMHLIAELNSITDNDINMDVQHNNTNDNTNDNTQTGGIGEEEYPHSVEIHYDLSTGESEQTLTVPLEVDRLAKDMNGKVMKFTKPGGPDSQKYHATDSPKHFINFKTKDAAQSFIEQIKGIKGVSVAIYQGKWDKKRYGYYGGIKRSIRRQRGK